MKVWLLALLLAAGDGKPVKVSCPVDGTRFTARRVSVPPAWGGIDADFCAHALRTVPLACALWTCPGCGYTARPQ